MGVESVCEKYHQTMGVSSRVWKRVLDWGGIGAAVLVVRGHQGLPIIR